MDVESAAREQKRLAKREKLSSLERDRVKALMAEVKATGTTNPEPMVAGLHLPSEEKPWEAHYHFNFYVLPVVRMKEGWVPLKRSFEKEKLEKVKRVWEEKVERIFGVELKEIDIKRG